MSTPTTTTTTTTPTTATTPTTTTIAELVDLSGKTAIVTGGAMGIGAGIVARLHEAGASPRCRQRHGR